jgi:hypothetical protein
VIDETVRGSNGGASIETTTGHGMILAELDPGLPSVGIGRFP